MRVALVHRDLHRISRGGICTVYLALAEELVRAGHQVFLVTQDTPHPVVLDAITVVTLPRTDDLTAHRAAVAAAIDRINPDVAECSTWEAELLTYAARRDRTPVLLRGDLSAATMGATALTAAEHRLCQLADTVVAVSEFAAVDLAAAYGITRPCVIANGVDRTRFTPLGNTRPASGWQVYLDDAGNVTGRRPLVDALDSDLAWTSEGHPDRDVPRLVWVGKFTHMKGFDRLGRIAAHLRGRARLLIVLGHGQVHYPLNLPRDVVVCQDLHPTDMPAVYRAADYLLSTSRWEGFGLAIAEALACGTPALVPKNLSVAGELITPGVTGQVWQDEPDLLRILAERPHLTGRLPDLYTWQVNAAATITTYQHLVSRAARAAP